MEYVGFWWNISVLVRKGEICPPSGPTKFLDVRCIKKNCHSVTYVIALMTCVYRFWYMELQIQAKVDRMNVLRLQKVTCLSNNILDWSNCPQIGRATELISSLNLYILYCICFHFSLDRKTTKIKENIVHHV